MSLTDDERLLHALPQLSPDGMIILYPANGPELSAAVRLATAYIEAGRVEGDGCPWCGSASTYDGLYEWRFVCGSLANGDHRKERTGSRTEYCKDRQIDNRTARLATVSAELAKHKRRLLEQSALLNSVRQERDHALLVVADLLDGADEHWQKTPRGVSVMAAGRELFAERKAGGE